MARAMLSSGNTIASNAPLLGGTVFLNYFSTKVELV